MQIKEKFKAVWQAMKDAPLLVFGSAAIAGLLSALTLTVLGLTMWTGLAYVMKKAGKDEKKDFNLLFKFMGKMPYLFALGVLMSAASFLGLLFLIIPGIFIMALFIYAPFYLAFEDKGIIESLRLSSTTAIEHNLMLHVVFVLVLWLINLIGMQLFIGWIITLPLSVGFMILMFEEVKITPEPASAVGQETKP
jgi:hypothetical protein